MTRSVLENVCVVCSKPGLKFVKEFLRFSLSRPGHWEDNNSKNHEEWPKESLMATNRRLIATNRRLIATNQPKSATNRPNL